MDQRQSNAPKELVVTACLADSLSNASLLSFPFRFRRTVIGAPQNRDRGHSSLDFMCCLEAIPEGHRKVKNGLVGLYLLGFSYRFLAVLGFALNPPCGAGLKQNSQSPSDNAVVVRNLIADRHRRTASALPPATFESSFCRVHYIADFCLRL
jgi:hypothetical protein